MCSPPITPTCVHTSLLLLLLLLLAGERCLLELIVLVRGRIGGVLLGSARIRLVRRGERRINAGLEAEERKVRTAGPGEDGEEREHDGSLHIVHTLAVRWIVRLAPLIGEVAETDKEQE